MDMGTWYQTESDNYSTTREVWSALLDQHPPAKIYDPCFFDGTAARFIASLGHVPVHDRTDFFHPLFVEPTYDILATNPPFSDPKPFIRRIVDITLKNGKPFAVLLPVATRECNYFAMQFGRLAPVGQVVEIQLLSLGPRGKVFIGPDHTPIRKGRGTNWFVYGMSLRETSGVLYVPGNRAGFNV